MAETEAVTETETETTPVEAVLTDRVAPIEAVLADNQVLATWVLGILEGCEGCIEDATKWAEGQKVIAASVHGGSEAEGEAEGEA